MLNTYGDLRKMDNLNLLADHLEKNVSDEDFDMWRYTNEKGEPSCALGHAATIFPEVFGLAADTNGLHLGRKYLTSVETGATLPCYHPVICEHFEIDQLTAGRLFCSQSRPRLEVVKELRRVANELAERVSAL